MEYRQTSGLGHRPRHERTETEIEKQVRYANEIGSNENLAERIKSLADAGDLAKLQELKSSKKLDLDTVDVRDWYDILNALFSKDGDEMYDKFISELLTPSNIRRFHLLLFMTFNSWRPERRDSYYHRPIQIAKRLLRVSPGLSCSIGEYDGKIIDIPSVHGAAKSGMSEILEDMLQYCVGQGKLEMVLNTRTDSGTPLNIAVSEGHVKCVEILLDFDNAIESREEELIAAIKRGGKDNYKIFGIMVSKCKSLVRDHPAVLETIVRKGATVAWDMAMIDHSHLLANSTLLHTAVEYKQSGMVQRIVERRPELVVKRDNRGNRPIFYNAVPDARSLQRRGIRNQSEIGEKLDDEVNNLDSEGRELNETKREIQLRKEIRDTILPEMVERMKANVLQEAFAEANNQLDEVLLNLSFFNPKSHDFGRFLGLIELETNKKTPFVYNISFEKHMRFVKFPDFDLLRREEHRGRFDSLLVTQNEITMIWTWLEVVHKVQRIHEVIVPDSLDTPHSEEFIEDCLSKWHVKVLNWRRTDLSIESIRKATTPPADSKQETTPEPTVRQLYLYSSGNRAAIAHWLSPDGIESLKLDKVHVIICRDLISTARGRALHDRVKKAMEELTEKLNGSDKDKPRREPKFSAEVHLEDWGTKDSSKRTQSWNTGPLHMPYTLAQLQEFLDFYKIFRKKHEENLKLNTKVALIDFGVDGKSMRISRQSHGISLVREEDGNCETNWWLATDEHGTQMAQIIQQIDPFCDLYPIKIANSNEGLNVHKLIAGINAAIERRVDMMCISSTFNLEHGSEILSEAVKNAAERGILLFCATADARESCPDPYPAEYERDYDEVISIASYKSGIAKRRYDFQGTEFEVDDIQYMKSLPSKVSGSSVATAVATGIASMVLSCSRFKNERPHKRATTIKIAFQKMVSTSEPKFVQPWGFFPHTKMSLEDGEHWVKTNIR